MRGSYCVLVLVFGSQITVPACVQQRPAPASERWLGLKGRIEGAYKQGRFADAAMPAEQDFELARETFGEDHPKTLKSLDNMAYYCSLQKRYDKAEPLFAQVLERRRAVLEA